MVNFGKDGKPAPVIAKISQETLAEMISTARSRVSLFMNSTTEPCRFTTRRDINRQEVGERLEIGRKRHDRADVEIAVSPTIKPLADSRCERVVDGRVAQCALDAHRLDAPGRCPSRRARSPGFLSGLLRQSSGKAVEIPHGLTLGRRPFGFRCWRRRRQL